MMEYIATFIGIYLMSLFKFISGPVLGNLAGYSLFEIMLVTVMGMMSSVFTFTFLGEWIKQRWLCRFKRKRIVFSPKNRKIVKIWQKSGAAGVALLTPLILSPIGGTLVMLSFGVPRNTIITYMLISSILWSFILGISIDKLLMIPFFQHLLH